MADAWHERQSKRAAAAAAKEAAVAAAAGVLPASSPTAAASPVVSSATPAAGGAAAVQAAAAAEQACVSPTAGPQRTASTRVTFADAPLTSGDGGANGTNGTNGAAGDANGSACAALDGKSVSNAEGGHMAAALEEELAAARTPAEEDEVMRNIQGEDMGSKVRGVGEGFEVLELNSSNHQLWHQLVITR